MYSFNPFDNIASFKIINVLYNFEDANENAYNLAKTNFDTFIKIETNGELDATEEHLLVETIVKYKNTTDDSDSSWGGDVKRLMYNNNAVYAVIAISEPQQKSLALQM